MALIAGCSNTMWTNRPTVPETSRTAVVHDVRVSLTDIVPTELHVNVGDEVRFINDKTQPVRIILIKPARGLPVAKGSTAPLTKKLISRRDNMRVSASTSRAPSNTWLVNKQP
jgi:plastocyanin